MNSLSLLLRHVSIYRLATEQKGQRQGGRPWKNKNISQTLSWHVRFELLRRIIHVKISNDYKFQSVREKKKEALSGNSVHMSLDFKS